MWNLNMIALAAAAMLLVSSCGQSSDAQILWDREGLESIKANMDDPICSGAVAKLCRKADKMMEKDPYSVMGKPEAPASGDMHDYMSLARYYWPNPNTEDGLPYVNRDGESNPEIYKYDRYNLGDMSNMVSTLSLAWFMTGDRKYSDKAAEQVRVWFFDEETRMNPNLEYAQVIRGVNGNKGRTYGLIDSYSFISMLDGICLLEQSPSFSKKDSKMLKAWFREFMDWYLNSEQGKGEYNNSNNHSIAYDVQVVAMAKYLGDKATVEEFVRTFPERRIYKQVEPDGSQPRELARTLAFGYSQYNLSHMIDIMILGKSMGIDITKAESEDGRSFLKAMDFLTPYAGKTVDSWPYRQISQWDDKQKAFFLDLYRTAKYIAPERQDYMDLFNQYYEINENNLMTLYIYLGSL